MSIQGRGGGHTGHRQGVSWEIGPKNYRLLKRENSGNFLNKLFLAFFRNDDHVCKVMECQSGGGGSTLGLARVSAGI